MNEMWCVQERMRRNGVQNETMGYEYYVIGE
jgi:hypothetical protein